MAENPILTRLKKKKQQQGTGSVRDEMLSFAENKPVKSKGTGTDFKASAQEAANRMTRSKIFSAPAQTPSRPARVSRVEAQDDYESRREGLKVSAQKEDSTNQRILELRKILEKQPTTRTAAVLYQQAQQEMQQMQSQKSRKVDPFNLLENQVPPSIEKLDTKLENISNRLKSGSETFGYNIKEGWLQGQVQDWLSTEYYRKMNGLPNQADKVEKFIEDHPDLQASYSQKGLQNFFKRATRGITQNSPMWIGGAKEGAAQGGAFALGFAGVTAAAGTASPLVVVPEEIVTVPGAAILGFRFGMSKGMAEYVARQEAAQAYMQYVAEGVDTEIAKPLAETVGVFNGVIEVAQIATIVKSVPGVKDFIQNASKMASKEAAKKLARIAASYGHSVGENVFEEMLQQGNTDIGGEIAKVVHEGKTGEQLKRKTFKEIAGDVLQTGLQAAVDFSLMPLGGVMKDLGSHIIKTETDKAKAIQTAKQDQKIQTAFRKAIHEDLPGSLKEKMDNMDTLKEKDALSMIALDNEMDKLMERKDLTPEDIAQIGTIKKDIGTIVEKVFTNAKKLAPEVKFEAPKERPAMIIDILSRKVETDLDDLTLDDYKTAQAAGVVDKISTMIHEGKDTSEIGNAIEKDLPKDKRKPEIISAIIDAVDQIHAEADGEIMMQKVKNIQAAMKSMPQNDVVTPEEDQNIDGTDKTLQNDLQSKKDANGVIDQLNTKTQATNENVKPGASKNKKGQAQKENQNKSDNKTELSTEDYKKTIDSTEYVDNLVHNVDKAKVHNEVAAQTNPIFKQFKDVVKAVSKNPIFNGLTFKFIDEDTTRFWKRSELDEAGYKHLKEGNYQVAGKQESNSDTGRTITLYRSSSKDTIAEELIHDLQKQMPSLDPELQDMISTWEENVHAQAAEEDYNIPTGYETFAKAMVFSEMGYAEANPDLATLFSVPDEIVDKFNSIMGTDLVSALTGKSESEIPKSIRLFDGKSKHVRGYQADDKAINEEAKRIIAEAIKKSRDIDFRTYADVGGKGKKSIIEEYPEFAPFYKDQAQELISDLNQTIKGDNTLVDTPTGKRILKTDRLTSESIVRIKDKTGASYESIGKALQSIIDGKVKTALARKIELILDDNLTDGYKNFAGETVKANQEYLNLKYGKEEASMQLKPAKEGIQILEDGAIKIDKGTQFTKAEYAKINTAMKRLGYDWRGADDTKRIFDKFIEGGYAFNLDQSEAIKELYNIGKSEEEVNTMEHLKTAKREFGLTDDFREAGYLTTDGKLLDFSQKRIGGSRGRRSADHREISVVYDYDIEGTEAMTAFMDEGHIRLQSYGFEVTGIPTAEQYKMLTKFINQISDEIVVDLATKGKHNTNPESIEYPKGTKASRIFADIENFYKTGEVTRSVVRDFHYQLKPVETFYSTLQQSLESKMPRRAAADQVMSIARSGAKEEEIKWSGLEEYLEGKDKVDKDDLLQYLKDNNLKIEENTHKTKDDALENGDYGITASYSDELNGWVVFDESEGELSDEDNNVLTFESMTDALTFARENAGYGDYEQSEVKYQKYKLSGGSNYREMLFTLSETFSKREYSNFRSEMLDKYGDGFWIPMTAEEKEKFNTLTKSLEKPYRSSHWDETNVLAHTRLQDFTDAEGNKVLFIEEIQSDWHQEGRRKGYKGSKWIVFNSKTNQTIANVDSRIEAIRMVNANTELEYITPNEGNLVPDAPFKKTWHEFVLKRMIRYAADHGYDGIAWTTGEQQNDRYDLSKQINMASAIKNKDGTYNLIVEDKSGNEIAPYSGSGKKVTPSEMEDAVGKDLTKKLIEGADRNSGREWKKNMSVNPEFYTVSGLDLKIGGEGMKGFYDGLVPSFLKKYLKKWKVDLQNVTLPIKEEMYEEGQTYILKNKSDQPGFMLNDEMKASAVYEGQPLYQLKEANFDVNRMSFYGTIEMNPVTDPALRAELQQIAGLYVVAHNQDTIKESLDLFYEMGTEAATKWVLGSTPATKEMNVIAQMLIKMNMDAKNYDTAIEIVDATARKAKDGGQATQVLSMFGRFTPEGIVRYTRKTYQKLLTEGQVNEVNAKADDLEKDLQKENKKAADDLDLTDIMQEIAKISPEEMLAKKIKNSLKDKESKEFDPVKLMVETLFKVYKDTIGIKAEKPIDNSLEFIAHALTQREEYREVWKQAREIIKDEFAYAPDVEEILQPYFDLILTQTFPDSMIEKATKTGLKDLQIKLEKIVRLHYSEVNKNTDTLVQKMINDAGLNGYEALMLEDYILKTMNKFTAEAKTRILDRMFKDRSTTARERKTLAQRIIELSNLGGFKSATYKGLIAAKLGFPALTDELITSLDYQAQQIQTMQDGHDKDLATAKMLDTIAAGIPVSFWRKVNTLQTMAQLLNFRTIIRNVVGNTAFQGIDRISRNFMIPLDVFASWFTGTRTKTYIGMKSLADRQGSAAEKWGGYLGDLLLGEGFRDGWDLGLSDAMAGVDTSGLSTQHDLPRTKTFRHKEGKHINNALAQAETVMTIALRVTDRAAFMAAFTESLHEQMKIAKVTEATQDMIDAATALGLYRTFQDANKISEFFVKTKKVLNMFGSQEFGLGDLILKYPKTPGNLLARAIDYSPLGVINVAFKLFFDAQDGKTAFRPYNKWKYESDTNKYLMQKYAVEGIGRAVTGTMLISAGLVLARLGIIAGAGDDDWDIYNMNQLAGLDKYQLNYSALLRWIGSGFNPDAAGKLKGDTLMSYDWFMPFATNIAVGADLALRESMGNQEYTDALERAKKVGFVQDKDADVLGVDPGTKYADLQNKIQLDNGIGFAGSIISSIQVGSETLANQPLLSGIKKLFGSRDVVAGIAEVAKSTPAGFVPTLFSQIAQLLDNEKKSTYDIKWTDESMRLVQRKIPGWASNLEPNLDVLGDPQKYYAGDSNPLVAAFYTFFSPAVVKKYNPSPEAEFVINLYQEFGDKKTVPTKLPTTIPKVEGVDVKLTPAEYTMLQEYSGQEIKKRLSKEEAADTSKLSEKVQIKRIDNIYSEVYNDVKEKIRKMRGIPKKKP